MKSSAIVWAVAATLSLGSLSALAQGRVYDRNASNNPEIYRQTHPEDAHNADNLQGPPRYRADRHEFDRREFERRRHLESRRALERQRDLERREFERRRELERRRDLDRRNWSRGHDASRYYYDYGARGPEFRRGGYIPREYRNRQYYLNDWRSHRLAAPPHGHQWVQVGSDYVLIAVATGLIAHLVLNQ